ncbi:MAG: C-type lectin domain-containing protein [Oscillospiraceae bacterium]|nr:C-type lectin domain-containing protein [Oscillospiraceae bacterium]
MKRHALIILSIALLIFTAALPASAGGTKPKIPEEAVSFNGHYYMLYDIGSDWSKVKAYVREQGGYLASITSQEENDFLWSYIQSKGVKSAYFGFSSEEEQDNWKWLSGEAGSCKVIRTSNGANEPWSESGLEFYAEFFYKYKDGSWNDGSFYLEPDKWCQTFLCEWEKENIDAAKAKGYIPDEAVYYDVTGNYYYMFKQQKTVKTWEAAKEYCEERMGHLATLTSKGENDLCFKHMRNQGRHNAYFGLYNPTHEEGAWVWVTGEPYEYQNWNRWLKLESDTYVNWHQSEVYRDPYKYELYPSGGKERQALFFGEYHDGTWADGDFEAYANDPAYGTHFICEWDAPPEEPVIAGENITGVKKAEDKANVFGTTWGFYGLTLLIIIPLAILIALPIVLSIFKKKRAAWADSDFTLN